VFAQQDPTSEAGGGGAWLAAAGLDVIAGVRTLQAEAVNEVWTFAVTRGRPLVTWKVAVSLDGRVAGPDGGPTAITGGPALSRVHDLRAQVGAILIGTGTALADDPALTVRIPGRETDPAPLRVVLGSRPIPSGARVLDSAAPTLVLDDPEPASVLSTLFDRGVRHVLLEGGPTLASAFLEARLVDRVEWYIAPVLLGAGPVALPPTAGRHLRGVDVTEVGMVGEDVRIAGRVRYDAGEA
jgi:diaminohydroxyphosphoribosylaminopyrimidine deaminase/5-amino-6-(5-phosphoribosylamino)uracil reductase